MVVCVSDLAVGTFYQLAIGIFVRNAAQISVQSCGELAGACRHIRLGLVRVLRGVRFLRMVDEEERERPSDLKALA
jgi:hypothetical protein